MMKKTLFTCNRFHVRLRSEILDVSYVNRWLVDFGDADILVIINRIIPRKGAENRDVVAPFCKLEDYRFEY